ncbi:hypothetical protein BGW80DRAFT_1258661 [Lactifluus volemus]|nr:hypothetical protein BGW80DRAFT_1258661 [Lactifluus volemus]
MVSSPAYALEIYDNYLKVLHAFVGLYIWEYLTTFGFEWNIYTRKRPWRWSYIPYIATRLLCLTSLILGIVGVNLKRPFNCDAWLRGIVVGLWEVVPHFFFCFGQDYRWSLLTAFVVNVTLLGTMIVGVIHKRLDTRLWKLLYYQGLFWISAAIFTEIPGVVMPFLNINEPWDVMFQTPLLLLRLLGPIEISSASYRHSRPPIIGSDSLLGIGMTRSGVEKHVAIKKTIESDMRFVVPNASVLASVSVPSRMGDEERGFYPEAQKKDDTEA